MAAEPIPEGYHSVTPYLVLRDAASAIAYYKKVFGAEELLRMNDDGAGKIRHAELRLGDSVVMMADEVPELGFKSPQSIGGTGTSMLVYVHDVDVCFKRALDHGARELRPVADQFYGDRAGTLEDPFGHVWTIATHVEHVPPEELQRRMEAAMQNPEDA